MKLFSWLMIFVVLGLMVWFYDQNADAFQRNVRFVYDIGLRDQLDFNSTIQGILGFGGFVGIVVGILVMLKPHFSLRRRIAEKNEEIQVLQRQLRQATLHSGALPQGEEHPALPESTSSNEEGADAATAAESSQESKPAEETGPENA